jgi:mycolic acid cyclopropane synthetase
MKRIAIVGAGISGLPPRTPSVAATGCGSSRRISATKILESLGRATRISMHHAENIGTHYARTLHAWRDRFNSRLDEVRALGFDRRFS